MGDSGSCGAEGTWYAKPMYKGGGSREGARMAPPVSETTTNQAKPIRPRERMKHNRRMSGAVGNGAVECGKQRQGCT